jgi:hypothetical protein
MRAPVDTHRHRALLIMRLIPRFQEGPALLTSKTHERNKAEQNGYGD